VISSSPTVALVLYQVRKQDHNGDKAGGGARLDGSSYYSLEESTRGFFSVSKFGLRSENIRVGDFECSLHSFQFPDERRRD
jgi:hypothetical protein